MLFSDNTFFEYKFPKPQYLGAKFDLLNWIYQFVPKKEQIVCLDAFGGSQSVAFYFKQTGSQVIANDFLNFNHQIGLALIENKDTKLNLKDIESLLQVNRNRKTLVEDNFVDIFFKLEDAIFLDNLRANIFEFTDKYKQSLALAIINRSLTRKITMGHFAHTQAINYANNPDRVKRNPNLVIPIKDIFLALIQEYNSAVFDNKKENKSYNQNILDLLPNLKNIDLVYFDPPYTDSHSDYQSFYHFLETYTNYWDMEFRNKTKMYYPKKYSGFDKKTNVIQSFEELFEKSQKIPNWLISWNDRSYPSVEDLEKIISKYRNVKIEKYTYQNSRGGKGSVKGSSEILFICSPKS